MFDQKKKQLVYIGSDHAGYEAKNELRDKLMTNDDLDVVDLGCFSIDPCDYPDIAREVSEKVLEHEEARGILVCGTGEGMAMSANKLKGIRAAHATSEELAEMSRKHNDANVIAMGARISKVDEMEKMVDVFLKTDFEKDQERHVRRVKKIDSAIEDNGK